MSDEDDRKLPDRALIGARLSDAELLQDYAAGLSLRQLAEKHGLGNPRKASKALTAALRRLDRRLISGVEVMRAAEYVNLQRLSSALDERASDPKAAAELRLQSESRRRLYGVDLERQVEGSDPVMLVVDMRLPQDRENASGEGIVEVPVVELPPQESRPALEAGDEEG